ncbi:MAG: DUF5985 family protein [Pseudomonadota bacterium]|nr:DUF5985 family protein [Pseudomonadota bacterium]
MAPTIYLLCALTSLAAAVLLLRAYLRTRFRLLLWSGLCFVGLTANNTLLVLDRLVFATIDLSTPRLATAFLAMLLLLVGLIWEGD